MFTGIVHHVGVIESLDPAPKGKRLAVKAPRLAAVSAPGDSIATNGVCLTVESVHEDVMSFTAVGETLERTTLGGLKTGGRVNLEAAATPATALGGHLVQGHVDGVGEVESFESAGDDRMLAVRIPKSIEGLPVAKGSIAIDGVSLTVVDVIDGAVVTITIVPYTIENTIIGGYRRGAKVNVEADIVGKYVMEYVKRVCATK